MSQIWGWSLWPSCSGARAPSTTVSPICLNKSKVSIWFKRQLFWVEWVLEWAALRLIMLLGERKRWWWWRWWGGVGGYLGWNFDWLRFFFFFFLMTFVLMWSGKCLLQLRILLCFPTAHPSHPRLLFFLNSHIKVYEAFHFESSRLFEAIGKKKQLII